MEVTGETVGSSMWTRVREWRYGDEVTRIWTTIVEREGRGLWRLRHRYRRTLSLSESVLRSERGNRSPAGTGVRTETLSS